MKLCRLAHWPKLLPPAQSPSSAGASRPCSRSAWRVTGCLCAISPVSRLERAATDSAHQPVAQPPRTPLRLSLRFERLPAVHLDVGGASGVWRGGERAAIARVRRRVFQQSLCSAAAKRTMTTFVTSTRRAPSTKRISAKFHTPFTASASFSSLSLEIRPDWSRLVPIGGGGGGPSEDSRRD